MHPKCLLGIYLGTCPSIMYIFFYPLGFVTSKHQMPFGHSLRNPGMFLMLVNQWARYARSNLPGTLVGSIA
ncbi:hypothetical protein BJX76DRAFT_339861 [Aspergillus varians]